MNYAQAVKSNKIETVKKNHNDVKILLQSSESVTNISEIENYTLLMSTTIHGDIIFIYKPIVSKWNIVLKCYEDIRIDNIDHTSLLEQFFIKGDIDYYFKEIDRLRQIMLVKNFNIIKNDILSQKDFSMYGYDESLYKLKFRYKDQYNFKCIQDKITLQWKFKTDVLNFSCIHFDLINTQAKFSIKIKNYFYDWSEFEYG